MSTARRRRGTVVGVVTLALAGVVAGGIALAGSHGGDSPTSTSAGMTSSPPPNGSVAASRTVASPTLASDGSVVTHASIPTSVATDPSSVRPSAPPSSADHPRDVQVVLTYAGYDASSGVSANGFVAETVEQGGTCTLKLTKDGTTVSGTAGAEPDASTTACGSLGIPAGRLSSGTWQARLSYTSRTSSGTSSTLPVRVP